MFVRIYERGLQIQACNESHELIANRFHGQRDAARAVIQVFIP